jgi:hypothetical protein
MQPSPRHAVAESHFRQLIDTADLPQPDEVESTPESLNFRWEEQKLVVALDLDGPMPTLGPPGRAPDAAPR